MQLFYVHVSRPIRLFHIVASQIAVLHACRRVHSAGIQPFHKSSRRPSLVWTGRAPWLIVFDAAKLVCLGVSQSHKLQPYFTCGGARGLIGGGRPVNTGKAKNEPRP